MNPRIQYIQCGCSRRYDPREFMALPQAGIQKDAGEGGGDLLLSHCHCGSTIAMEVTGGGGFACLDGREHATLQEADECDLREKLEDMAANPRDYEATE